MIFSLILAGGAFALIAWLIFNLSAYALPFFVGLTAAFYAHGSGAGLVGSGVVGLIAGALTFAFGQIAFSMARSTMARGLVAAVFAVPATGAGYYSTSGIVELCIPGHGWRLAFSLVGAVVTGAVAYMRLAAFAQPRVERGGAEDFIAAHAGTDANR